MARRAKHKNLIIADLSAGADPLDVIKKYPVTPSYVYKLGKQIREEKKAAVVEGKFKVEQSSEVVPSGPMPAAEVKRRLGLMARLNSGLDHNERFYADPTGTIRSGIPSPYTQLVTSSLKRYGGDVADEYLRELQGSRGVQIYKEMGNDAIVSATLSAVKMTLRRVTW